MNEINFRKLEWQDVDKIIEIRKKQLVEEGGIETIDLTKSLIDFFERNLLNGNFISWIATNDNEIIATSGMSFVEKPPYYSNITGKIGLLSSMYTAKPYRRKGIAKKLLELIINEAKEYGCAVIYLTASDMGVPLYENFGFEKNNNFYQFKIK